MGAKKFENAAGQQMRMSKDVRDMLDSLVDNLEDDAFYDHIRAAARASATVQVVEVINTLAHGLGCNDSECGRTPDMTDDELYAGLALAGKMLTSVGQDKPAKGAKHADAWAELIDLINA